MVRFGRRIKVAKSAPELKLTPLTLATKIVFGPSDRIMSRSELSNPRINAVIPTIEVMPITTPSTVSPDRILLPRSVSNAMRQTSPSSPLFTAERLDWIQPGRARRGIGPKEQADCSRDADPQQDGPELEFGRQRREAGDGLCGEEPQADANQPAERRQRHRLRQDLRHDVAAFGAERLS